MSRNILFNKRESIIILLAKSEVTNKNQINTIRLVNKNIELQITESSSMPTNFENVYRIAHGEH